MPEVLDRPGEAQEKVGEGRKLTPVGIDRLQTPNGIVQVIRAKDENGADVAVVLGVDELPLEMTLGDNNPGREGGALSRLAKNPVAKFVGGISGLAASALGVAACSPGTDSYSGNNSDPAYSTHSGSLTTDQMMGNIQGQPAPWTDWGDTPGNFGEIDGKKVIFIGSNYDGTTPDWSSDVSYIECDQLSQCFDASATRQTVEGLKEAGLAGPYESAGIYKDQNGKYKFLVDSSWEFIYEGNISKNPLTGKLKVENLKEVDPLMDGSFSIYFDTNGNPHAVHGFDNFGYDKNLFTNIQTKLPDTASGTYEDCGSQTLDGNLAIGSKLSTISGVKHCSLVMAASLEDLATKAAAIVSLNSQATGAVKRLGNPRLVTDTDGSGILIYSSTNGSPGNLGGNPLTKIWYALIPKPVPPVEPDATGDATDTDVVTPPDTATVTDTGPGEPEVAVEPDVPTAEDIADAIAEDVEAVKDVLADIGVDLGELQEIFDATAEVEPDTTPPTPDITAPAFIDNFAKVGDCTLTYASINEGGKDGYQLDIDGNGSPEAPCVLTGLSNDKPVTVTITSDKDGKIKLGCKVFPAAKLDCSDVGLNTKPLIKEDGAGATATVHGYVMGSEASQFYGVPREQAIGEDGKPYDVLEVWNAKGEKPVTAKGPNFTFKVEGDGVVWWVNKNTAKMSTTNPFEEFPKPAEGSGIDISAQKFDAGSAESGGADATTGPDATITNPPKPGEGGCNTGSDGSPLTGEGALLMAALMLWFRRRKQGARQ